MVVCTHSFNTCEKIIYIVITFDTLRELALSFPETTEVPHFERTSFRVKKKIFATYDDKQKRVTVKLSEMDQDIFSSVDKTAIYPVKNKWGRQGWTTIELELVCWELFVEVLTTAYCEVAPNKLGILVRPDKDG